MRSLPVVPVPCPAKLRRPQTVTPEGRQPTTQKYKQGKTSRDFRVAARIEPKALRREHFTAPAGGMLIVAAGGAIIGADVKAGELFALASDELLDAAFGDLLTLSGDFEDGLAMRQLAVGKTLSERPTSYRARGRRRDDGEFFVDVLVTPITSGGGSGFVAAFGEPSANAIGPPGWFTQHLRWRALLEELGDTFFIWDIKADRLEYSRSWLSSMDYEPHELASSSAFFDYLHPDDLDDVRRTVDACVNGNCEHFSREFRLRNKSGEYRWIAASARVVEWFEEHGSPLLAGFYRDTTDKRRALEDLARTETRWDHALRGSRLGVWDWNLVTGETFFSAEWKRMLGYEPGDLEPTIDTWRSLALPQDLALSDTAISAYLAGETAEYRAECRMRDRNGEIKWVLDRGRVVERAPDGTPLRMIGTHDDITLLKQREVELVESRERLRRIASLLPGVVYQFEMSADGSMRFPYASEGMYRLYGVSPAKACEDASCVFEQIHPDDLDAVTESVLQSAASMDLWDREFRLRETDSKPERWVHGVANPQPGPAGDGSTLWHGYVSDITERKRTELALERRTLDLQLANEDLEQFNYVAAHDLKQPLRSIRHLGEWIADELPADVPESLAENLERLQARTLRLGALIDGLAEYSRAGRRDVQLKRIDPVVMARELVEEIDGGGTRIRVIGEPGTVFPSSEVALQTVLRNLIVNALVHHHDPGNCHVTVTVEAGSTHVAIAVEDDGPGIEAIHHERVFRMYQRLDPDAGKPGSGSGLAIVKRIVDSVGSKIEVESPIDKGGCRFRFAWPLTWPYD